MNIRVVNDEVFKYYPSHSRNHQLTKTHWDWWYALDKEWQEILLECLVDDLSEGEIELINQLSLEEKLLKIVNLEELFFEWNGGIKNSSFKICDLSALHRLHKLIIVNCTGLDYQNLATAKHLTYLTINKSHLVDLDGLKTLKTLKTLSLYGNEIVDISSLSKLEGLISLDLSLNFIRDISPLETLTKLECLNIADNPIDEIKINHLKNKLPNCVINSESVDSLLACNINTFDEFELAMFNDLK